MYFALDNISSGPLWRRERERERESSVSEMKVEGERGGVYRRSGCGLGKAYVAPLKWLASLFCLVRFFPRVLSTFTFVKSVPLLRKSTTQFLFL